jgi:osmotically inducible protein OsmC
MLVRRANAIWKGTIRSGSGLMRLGSGAWEGPYTFASRFENGEGTNPEELIGAAHAGCFSMALAAALAERKIAPDVIRTDAEVGVEPVRGGYAIRTVRLVTRAVVPGIDEAKFREWAEDAKRNCPVSRALTGVSIELDALLVTEIAPEAPAGGERSGRGPGSAPVSSG